MIPLVLGYEPIPESISIEGGRPDLFLLEPVTAAAVVFPAGWVLLDSGFNVDVVRDPERRAALLNYESYTPILPPGDPLADQVAAAGLAWDGLAACALSHLHLDHTGGLRLLPDRALVVMQEREWEWLAAGAGRRQTVIPADVLDRVGQVRLVDGDVEIAPGLAALDTRGHTPGHQSFRVSLPNRDVVLACDAADLERNLTELRPCGWTARPEDADDARRSVERLAALVGPGVEVWPGHDPRWHPWRVE